MENKEIRLTKNSKTILERRYLLRNDYREIIETPKELFMRVARSVALAEKEEERERYEKEFFNMMAEFEFLPNSPTLMNAGTELGMLSACFVIPVIDSIEGIFDAVKNVAVVHRLSGGTGMSFSELRPAGDLVSKTKGKASGPLSFMTVFNAATETIIAGGKRRGANMGTLRVDHPDIEEFIVAKDIEGNLSNFNISVTLTDKFMDAYRKGYDFDLINPKNGEVKKTVKAKEIFDKIVKQAWKNGEPGVIFIDTINKFNPTPEVGEIRSVNPCVAGDTLIATEKGYEEVKDIKVGDKIITLLGEREVCTLEKTKAKVFKVCLSDGGEIRCTAKHQFRAKKIGFKQTKEFPNVKLEDLKVGDFIRVHETKIPENATSFSKYGDRDVGFIIGVMLGDGEITKRNIELKEFRISSSEEHIRWNKNLESILTKLQKKGFLEWFRLEKENSGGKGIRYKVKSSVLAEILRYLDISGDCHTKRISKKLKNSNKEVLVGLLDGLISTDGNINLTSTHPAIRYASCNKGLIRDIRDVLLCFGIHMSLGISSENRNSVINGRIVEGGTKYEAIITGKSFSEFYKKVSLSMPEKEEKMKEAVINFNLSGNTWKARILSIEEEGIEDVYDLYEPESDTWLTNGYVSRGCGEQPLLPNESCNLASINLSKMVKKNDKEKYELDVDRLKEVTHLGVRFLDDVISVNKFPLQEIKLMTEENRKIGLGVMGFADMLIKLGVRYDSEEAVKMAKKVMKIIQDEAFAYSIELAKERGEFPNFNKSIYKDKQKIRNATRTTIAPTGTISMIAGCSSGIEPLFAIVYTKTVLDDDKLIEVNPLFEEIAKEKGFYSKDLMERIAKKGTVQGMIDVPIDIQEIFVAAQDISPEWHIKIQAAFQQYVDNAVSKTCNLPNDATEEDIRKIYEMAYDLGLKGITVYRDGSRDRQVVETRERAIKDKNKRLRPRVTIGQTEKINTGCGGLYITTNQDKEGLFEVFIQMGKAGMCATSQNEAIARLISLGLRSGIQLSEVVEQLKGIRCPMPTYDEDGKLIESCADAIAKVLRNRGNVILEELEAQMEAIPLEKEEKPRCPECQGVLTYEEGCIMCKVCGYSKCG